MFKWRWELTLGEIFTNFDSVSCIWIRRTSVSTYIFCFLKGTSYPSSTVYMNKYFVNGDTSGPKLLRYNEIVCYV